MSISGVNTDYLVACIGQSQPEEPSRLKTSNLMRDDTVRVTVILRHHNVILRHHNFLPSQIPAIYAVLLSLGIYLKDICIILLTLCRAKHEIHRRSYTDILEESLEIPRH